MDKIKTMCVFTMLCLCTIANQPKADWQSNKIVTILSPFNSGRNNSFIYNNSTNKIFMSGAEKTFIVDPETLITLGKLEGNNQLWSYSLFIDNERDILYSVGSMRDGGQGLITIDTNTQEVKGEYAKEKIRISPYAFTIDKKNNKIYFINEVNEFSFEKNRYLFSIDGSSLTEDYRIELPQKNTFHEFEGDSYRSLLVDEETDKLYIVFRKPYSKNNFDRKTFVSTHNDSVYVYDLSTQKLSKTIPVSAGASFIMKNYTSGIIYVYCNSNYIPDGQSMNFSQYEGSHGFVVAIDPETSEPIKTIEFEKQYDSRTAALSEKHNLLYCAGNIISGSSNSVINTFEQKQNLYGLDPIQTCYDEMSDTVFELYQEHLHANNAKSGKMKNSTRTGIALFHSGHSIQRNELYYAYNGDNNSVIGIIDLADKTVKEEITTKLSIEKFCSNSQGNILFIASSRVLYKYNIETKTILESTTFYSGNLIQDIVYNENDQKIYVLSSSRSNPNSYLNVFGASPVKHIKRISLGLKASPEIEFNKINNDVYVREDHDWTTDYETNKIKIIDGLTLEIKKEGEIERVGMYDGKLKLDASHNILYSANKSDRIISMYKADSLEKIGTINCSTYGHGSYITLNESSNELYVRGSGNVSIIDLVKHEEKAVLPLNGSTLYCPPFFNSITRKYYVVSSSNATVQIYENPDYPGYPPPLSTHIP